MNAPPAPHPPAPALPAQVHAWLQALEAGLLEREAAVRLALLAALAGEHVLLIGPPGSAKSELARRLHRAFDGAPYFERLLTRFSTPEELFGPLSLAALEADRYERLIEGYLPCAGLAFLDEVFKANSAILNALLTLLNEREYDHGRGRIRTPLISVVAASNEVPQDEALHAFYDRFLLRIVVQPVSDASFPALLALPEAAAAPTAAPFSAAQRAALRQAATGVVLDATALQALQALRAWAAARGVAVSDRRWRQLAQLLRVQAASEGRAQADALDAWLCPAVVADTAEQAEELSAWFAREVLQATAHSAPWLTRAVEAFEQQLRLEEQLPAEEGDDTAGKLALARAMGAEPGADTGALRIRAATLEAQLRKRFSPVHLAARAAQLAEVRALAQRDEATLQQRLARLDAWLAGRLWVPQGQAAAWRGALAGSLAVNQQLQARLQATAEGFAALPQDPQLPPQAPAPVAWAEA